MNKTFTTLIAAAALSVALIGQANAGSKTTWGTILGAAVGGVGGAQFGKGNGKTAATIVGTLLGATLGAGTGRSLDRADDIYDGRRVVSQPRYQQSRPVYRQQRPVYQQRQGTFFGTRDTYNESRATYESLEYGRSGQAQAWQNPDGQQGFITPQPAYQERNGRYCREFTSEVTVGGRVQQAFGTACRQPDGQWQIVN